MKYVAISDLHLGQNGSDGSGQCSTLSSNPAIFPEGSLTRRKNFIVSVQEFANGQKINLILNGDAMDLSLANMDFCIEELKRLISDLDCIAEVDYVVGNHDHHLWMQNCDELYLKRPTPTYLPIYEPTLPRGNFSSFLAKRISDVQWRLAYPIFNIDAHNGERIIFTHGHLAGGLYTLFSRMLQPYIRQNYSGSYAAATINIPITESIYWLLGKMGCEMGTEGIIEAVFSDIEQGKSSLANELVDRLVDSMFPDGLVKNFPDSWERGILKWAGKRLIKHFVAKNRTRTASMTRYQDDGTTVQEMSEWVCRNSGSWTGVFQEEGTNILVSGHTHTIIQKDKILPGKMKPNVEYLNLGSWLIEPGQPNPQSAALFIDDSPDVLSYRMRRFNK